MTGLNPNLLLAVPLAPLAGSAIAGLLGTKFVGNVVGRKVSHTATILGVLIAFLISFQTLMAVLDGATYNGSVYRWMTVAGINLEVGFQIDSLPESRAMREDGAEFKSYVDGSTICLTPERSIATQRSIGSDIMMVLDQCVPSTVDHDTARRAISSVR